MCIFHESKELFDVIHGLSHTGFKVEHSLEKKIELHLGMDVQHAPEDRDKLLTNEEVAYDLGIELMEGVEPIMPPIADEEIVILDMSRRPGTETSKGTSTPVLAVLSGALVESL